MPKRLKFGGALLLGMALAISGCSSSPKIVGSASDVTLMETSVLPTPGLADTSDRLGSSYLGPSDLVQITVAGVEWLTDQQIRVDLNGEISFPLAGPISVAGLSPRELEAVLTDRLISNGRMVAPKVSVNVMEVLSQTVTVEGQVKRPGIYPVTQRLSLLQAVAMAQGTDEFSDLEDVVVFRTVNNTRYAALYDLDAIRHGNYADPRIFPSDIVMVGDENSRRRFKDILAIVPLITSPLVIAFDRFAN